MKSDARQVARELVDILAGKHAGEPLPRENGHGRASCERRETLSARRRRSLLAQIEVAKAIDQPTTRTGRSTADR
jgi:hypothetical protein